MRVGVYPARDASSQRSLVHSRRQTQTTKFGIIRQYSRHVVKAHMLISLQSDTKKGLKGKADIYFKLIWSKSEGLDMKTLFFNSKIQNITFKI